MFLFLINLKNDDKVFCDVSLYISGKETYRVFSTRQQGRHSTNFNGRTSGRDFDVNFKTIVYEGIVSILATTYM